MTEEKGEPRWQFYLAGVKHHQLPTVIQQLDEGDKLNLVLEPTNTYDPNAVRVEHEGVMLGYVPARISKEVSNLLNIKGKAQCTITRLSPEAAPWNMLMVEVKESDA